jgi:hypothetical protein
MTITIREPAPYTAITNVLRQGTGQIGQICACGNAVDDKHGVINGVWAQAVAIGTVLTDPHPGGAQPGSYDQTTGNWWFLDSQLVPNVPCYTNPTANTYLFAVWCSYQGGTNEEHQSTQFAAKCATSTNCVGSGNPCAGISLLPRRAAAGAAAGGGSSTVSIAPSQYQVKGQGARGPLASRVNATWALSLRTGGCGCTFAWDNQGDGVRVARVVLRPDGVISTEWNLTLVLDGRRAQYTCPAPEWNAIGVNRLRRVSGDDALPKSLTVRPL